MSYILALYSFKVIEVSIKLHLYNVYMEEYLYRDNISGICQRPRFFRKFRNYYKDAYVCCTIIDYWVTRVNTRNGGELWKKSCVQPGHVV